MVVRWRSDFDKFTVISNFERRGWQKYVPGEGEDWNVYWATVGTVKAIFSPESSIRLEPHQLINHFPNHYELTRKDLMVKNVKRYLKQLKRDGVQLCDELDFVPATYLLPQDYSLFVEEFRRTPNATWIMKPTGRAQGKGIFLVNKLSQIKKWAGGAWPNGTRNAAESYIVSRYVENPLLVGGKKFDLRMYVVVLSFKPLRAYVSDQGFARFCNVKYTLDNDEMDNAEMHLTNVAIQKHGEDYNASHGNKWPIKHMRLYLEAIRGQEATDVLFQDINSCILHSLRACQNVMINDRHCFEVYGYDIIIDGDLKPWLIEANASPSLSATTKADRLMKTRVINDTLRVVVTPEYLRLVARPKTPYPTAREQLEETGPLPRQVGSLHLLADETGEMLEERARRDAANATGGRIPKRQTTLGYSDRPVSAF